MTLPQSDENQSSQKKKVIKDQEKQAEYKSKTSFRRESTLKGILLVLSIISAVQFCLIVFTMQEVTKVKSRLSWYDENIEILQKIQENSYKVVMETQSSLETKNSGDSVEHKVEHVENKTPKEDERAGKITKVKDAKIINNSNIENDKVIQKENNQITQTKEENTEIKNDSSGIELLGEVIEYTGMEFSSKNSSSQILKRTKRKSRKRIGKGNGKGKRPRKVKSGKNKAVGIHVRTKPETTARHYHTLSRVLKGWNDFSPSESGFDISKTSTEGILTVKTPGLYYVYSQVLVQHPSSYVTTEISVGLRGTQRFSKCYVHLPGSTPPHNITCSTSGIVALQKDDGVSVRVYPSDAVVSRDPLYTYFGAFLIGTV